jgi:hypothetical protein
MHTILIAADNRKIREIFPQDPTWQVHLIVIVNANYIFNKLSNQLVFRQGVYLPSVHITYLKYIQK